jgi:hypothetical protein
VPLLRAVFILNPGDVRVGPNGAKSANQADSLSAVRASHKGNAPRIVTHKSKGWTIVSIEQTNFSRTGIGIAAIHLLIASLAAVLLPASPAVSGWPACERHRITHLHYECVNPGAQCAATKYCRDVSVWLWKDCKCKDVKAAITYRIDGGGALDIAAVDLYANGSTQVFYDDLLITPVEPPSYPADLNEDEKVNVFDLLMLLEAWGSCD